MRILLSSLQSRKCYPVAAYQFWRTYFKQGCQEVGIQCLEIPGVDWAEALIYPPGSELEAWRARTWEAVLTFVRRQQAREPIDFFLGYLYPKQVDVSAINDLKQMGIPAVNFFCDNVREFRRIPIEYQPFTLHWVPEFEALQMYRRAKLAYLHAPMACWVPLTLRSPKIVETEPPTFIGSADILRRDLLGRAIKNGGDLIVCGRDWQTNINQLTKSPATLHSVSKIMLNQWSLIKRHGVGSLIHKVKDRLHPLHSFPMPDSNVRDAILGQSEYFRVTREAMVTIGVNRVHTARTSIRRPLTYSRLRDIEAPMLGACYLTEWTEGLSTLYELGTEIEAYRTAEELTEKLIELRQDPQRRKAMRRRAQRRALADHSVARTIERISKRLGLRNGP